MVSGKLNMTGTGEWMSCVTWSRQHQDEWTDSLEDRRIYCGSQHLVCSLSLNPGPDRFWILAFQHLSQSWLGYFLWESSS